jgi:hypothetical protein
MSDLSVSTANTHPLASPYLHAAAERKGSHLPKIDKHSGPQ